MGVREDSDALVSRDSPQAAELRVRIRHLIAEHLPPEWLGPFTNDRSDFELSNRFCEVLAEEGLLVPDWPRAYGGRDLDLASSIVIREEMWAHFEPRGGQYYGPNWIGPSIAHYGTAAQKALHLPLIAQGKGFWCQGFSEPDAGSDLANLSTRAVPDGDGFRITGQKVWTSWALWADWCYLLARVDGMGDGTDRHAGITVFLLPMHREGITRRGLDGLPGPHHLNEVFFDEVWVDRGEVLGEVGAGWQVIRDALSNERVGIARYARDDRLIAQALEDPTIAASLPANRWLEARVRNRMARLICRRALWFQRDGGSHDFIVNAARMITTRSNLTTADAMAEAVADRFFEGRYDDNAMMGGAPEVFWRYMQAGTVASGTTEMLQRGLSRSLLSGERIRATEGVEELAATIERFAAANGGVDCARQAIEDPSIRHDLREQLESILSGLDPRSGMEEGLAASEVCRLAGGSVMPLPVEAILLRRDGELPLTRASHNHRFEHADLYPEWVVSTEEGTTEIVRPTGPTLGSKVGSFVNRDRTVAIGSSEPLSERERVLTLILPCWYLMGAAEKALDIAAVYANDRVQFGAPIGSRQGVSFPLADACSELQALYELALYSIRNIYESARTAFVDALALRWATLDIVRRVIRSSLQVMGAVGQCDEHDMTIVVLMTQGRLRLPWDLEATMGQLVAATDSTGFDSLYTPIATNDTV